MRGLLRRRLHVDPAPHTRQFFDNLLVTTQGKVFAGFRMGALGDVRWDYTGPEAKALTLSQHQDGWALLEGSDYFERGTTRPWPVAEHFARLDARTPNPLPDVHLCDRTGFSAQELADGRCGCFTYNAYLQAQQNRIISTGQDAKIWFRYFHVGDVGSQDLRAQAQALRTSGKQPSAEAKAAFAKAKQIGDAVAGPAWLARKMTEREQTWLRLRSLGIGIPTTAVHDAPVTDVAALSTDVRWTEHPFDRGVKVTAWRNGRQVERFAQVLTLAVDAPALDYPDNGIEPWKIYAERAVDPEGMPIAHEWAEIGRIKTGAELKSQAELDLRKAYALEHSYEEFDEEPREDIGRGIERAREVRDAVTTGAPRDAARFVGTVNLVVWGEDVYHDGKLTKTAAEAAEERADAMRRLYAGNGMGFVFVPPAGQAAKLAEFVPGEWGVRDTNGYQRQWDLAYHATSLPHVSGSVGDGLGSYQGPTRGAAPRPTFHDSHYATEGRATGRGQNLWVWVTTLGGGKTVGAAGCHGYHAVRRGIRTLISDPSGPTLRLCELPELKPYAHGFNLLKGEDGILNPPGLVRDPILVEFADHEDPEDAHARALQLAENRRESLTRDAARRMLEADLYDHPGTRSSLRRAARQVTWTRERTLWDLVRGLEANGDEHSLALAEVLREAADLPRLSLLFAPEGQGGDYVKSDLRRATLTVVATPGLRKAPESKPRAEWDVEDLTADAVLYLAGLYTGREVFDKPMQERAVVVLDEAETLTEGAMGNAFLSTLGRDHSKWNIEAHLLLKNLNEVVMEREILNFTAGFYIGRMAQEKPALDLLDHIGHIDRSYAKSLLRLSDRRPGEFVHIDADGRVGGMAFDLGWAPHLQDAMFTTPDPTGQGAWAHADEEVLG